MDDGAFFSHGKMNISVDNNLVTLDIEGPCNTEFFQYMSEELQKVRHLIDLNNYSCLVILHKDALATPDAMLYFTNYLKTLQVKAVAINVEGTNTPKITKASIQKAYIQAGIKHQFFTDNTIAIAWLRDCMAAPQ